jgi:hypothetical protein
MPRNTNSRPPISSASAPLSTEKVFSMKRNFFNVMIGAANPTPRKHTVAAKMSRKRLASLGYRVAMFNA